MKKAFKFLSNVFTVLLFAASIFVILRSTVAAKQNKPAFFFGYSFSVVITESMEPTINVDDMIIYRKAPIEDVKMGDIIVFRSLDSRLKGSAITHRVTEITNVNGAISLTTKGDNNASADYNPVTADNFYGIVTDYGTFLGIGNLINGNRSFIFLLIILCFLALAFFEVKNIYSYLRKDKEARIREEMRQSIMKEEGLLPQDEDDKDMNKQE
jgi:signal peptidase